MRAFQRCRYRRPEVAGKQGGIDPASQEIRPQEFREGFIFFRVATCVPHGARQATPGIIDQLCDGLGQSVEGLAFAVRVERVDSAAVLHDEPELGLRQNREVRQLADEDRVLAIVGKRSGQMMVVDDKASFAWA